MCPLRQYNHSNNLWSPQNNQLCLLGNTMLLLSFDSVVRPVYYRRPQCFWHSSPTTSGEQPDILKFYFALMFCVGVTITSLVALCFHNWCCFSCPKFETGPENCIPPKKKLFATLALALLGLLDIFYLQMIVHRQKMHEPIQWLHCALFLLSPSLSKGKIFFWRTNYFCKHLE